MRHVPVGCADGNSQFGIAGIINSDCEPRTGSAVVHCAVARVPSRDHHYDAGSNEPIHLYAERTLAARKPFWIEIVSDTDVNAVNKNSTPVPVDLLHISDRGD